MTSDNGNVTPLPTARGRHMRALERALRDAPPLERDRAAAALAKTYAEQLDARPACQECGAGTPAMLAEFGPKWLTALSALGLTPAGRGVKGGPAPAVPPDPAAAVLLELEANANRRRPR